jgi:ABC-type Fe3+ transport system permease subunit
VCHLSFSSTSPDHPDGSSLLSFIVQHSQHSVISTRIFLFQVPLLIPVLVIAVALFLCLVPIITDPSLKYFIAPVLIGLACILYVPFVYYKFRPEWMSKYLYF